LLLAAAVLLAIFLAPTPAGLSIAGQRMLAVFGFAVIVWVTDALDYAVSAVVILVIGAIVVSTVLALPVPSATARAAAVIPIIMGIIVAFGVDKKSRFAGLLMITTVQAVSIWNVSIKTAAAQNMVAIGFIQKMLGHDITWLSWLVAAALGVLFRGERAASPSKAAPARTVEDIKCEFLLGAGCAV
jgi:di/tricarboxylate transporter